MVEIAARNRPRVRTASPAPSKATLFCPGCGHRSRFDGDWTVVDTERGSRYLCPECGTEITVRPTLTAGEAV